VIDSKLRVCLMLSIEIRLNFFSVCLDFLNVEIFVKLFHDVCKTLQLFFLWNVGAGQNAVIKLDEAAEVEIKNESDCQFSFSEHDSSADQCKVMFDEVSSEEDDSSHNSDVKQSSELRLGVIDK